MGIHGLTHFIDKNPHVLNHHQLKDCSVVVDGNNFYHFLYYACHVRYRFGGDYDFYRKKIISVFQSFEKCCITPYVVFDGAYTIDGRKTKTSLERAQTGINDVHKLNSSRRGKVLPILAYDTFIQALTEIGVKHFTCQFEADNDIAVLANKLNCPVISNDSDFYIFDLSAGFLPLDYIDFKPAGKKCHMYLPCEKYFVDTFIEAFIGLSRPMLPVLASMLGNDFISASDFETFYAKINVPKVVSKQFSLPPRLSKVVCVLHWLHTQAKDFSGVVDQILKYIRPDKRNKVKKLFMDSIKGYKDIDEFDGFNLYNFFTAKEDEFPIASHKEFRKYKSDYFPKWFLKAVCFGNISPSILNACVSHRVILRPQIEHLPFATSYNCSQVLRNIQYGVLLKEGAHVKKGSECVIDYSDKNGCHGSTHSLQQVPESSSEKNNASEDSLSEASASCHLGVTDNSSDIEYESEVDEEESLSETDVSEDSEATEHDNKTDYTECLSDSQLKSSHVEEYHRSRRSLKKFYAKPIFSVGNISVPSLEEIGVLSQNDRLLVLLAGMGIQKSFFENFAEELLLYSGCLLFWIRNADPKVTLHHLNSVLLCSILLFVREKLTSEPEDRPEEESNEDEAPLNNNDVAVSCDVTKIDIHKICQHSDVGVLLKVKSRLAKYYDNKPTLNNRVVFDPTIVHAFAQLQTCLLDASNLNKVLRFPVPNVRPAQLIHGMFLYNIYNELGKRPKPDLFIVSLLGEKSEFHQLFLQFRTAIVSNLGNNSFSSPLLSKRKSKKKKKAKAKSEVATPASTDNSDSEDESSEDSISISGFDVHNRFSLLNLK